nr:MAG: putative peptidase [Eriocheir sinensis sobemo-like virus 2]
MEPIEMITIVLTTLTLWELVRYLCRLLAQRFRKVSVTGKTLEDYQLIGEDVACRRVYKMTKSDFQFESIRKNSKLEETKSIHQDQVALLDKEGVFIGYGIRFEAGLVLPHHVWQCARNGFLIGPTGKQVALEGKLTLISTDLAIVDIPNKSWSTLGVKVTKPIPVAGNTFAEASGNPLMDDGLVRLQGHRSFGYVEPASFGMLHYGGSTRRGMSGCGYYVGDKLAGLHIGGGLVNHGYAASFIHAITSHGESTEDYLLDLVKRRKRGLDYRRVPGLVGEVAVCLPGGKFTVMEEDDAHDLGILGDELFKSPEGAVSYEDQVLKMKNVEIPSDPTEAHFVGKVLEAGGEAETIEELDSVFQQRLGDQAQKLRNELKAIQEQRAKESVRPKVKASDTTLLESQINDLKGQLKAIRDEDQYQREQQKKDIQADREYQQSLLEKKNQLEKELASVSVLASSRSYLTKNSKSALKREKAKAKKTREDLKQTEMMLELEKLRKLVPTPASTGLGA